MRSKDSELMEGITGTAALYLLEEREPVNRLSMIRKLQAMAVFENDDTRRICIGNIIDALSRNEGGLFQPETLSDDTVVQKDNVYPLFTAENSEDPVNKR